MDSKTTKNLLQKVRQDYQTTAQEFSDTRFRIWRELKNFQKYLKPNDKILDLGCGNGRLYELFKNQSMDYTGADNCQALIDLAKKKYHSAKFIFADALNLPFENNEFDAVFSVAMLHQIPSQELRIKTLSEIKRVLKNNGILILTCWNLRQLKLILKYKLWNLIIGFKKKNLDIGDVFIPWKSRNGKVIQRYYHAFTLKELNRIVKKSNFKIINYTKNNNLIIIAKNIKV